MKGVRSWNVPAHISVASCALSLSFTFIFTHTHGKSQEDKCTYRERIKPGGTDRYSSNRERKRERLTLIGVIKTTQQSIKPWHCGTTEESAQLVVFVCVRHSFPRWCVWINTISVEQTKRNKYPHSSYFHDQAPVQSKSKYTHKIQFAWHWNSIENDRGEKFNACSDLGSNLRCKFLPRLFRRTFALK